MSILIETFKRTPVDQLEAMDHHDLVVLVHQLETQRLTWTKRVALYERRSLGLEELLSELVNTLKAVFERQREELNRVAGIASNVVMYADRKAEELEALCDEPEAILASKTS